MRFSEETCKTCENNVISIISKPLDLYLQSVQAARYTPNGGRFWAQPVAAVQALLQCSSSPGNDILHESQRSPMRCFGIWSAYSWWMGTVAESGVFEVTGGYNYTISANTNSPIKKNDGGKWWSKRSLGSMWMCVLRSAITHCTLSAFTKTAGRDENYYLLVAVLLKNINFFNVTRFQLLMPLACFSQIVYFYTEFSFLACVPRGTAVSSLNGFLLCLKGHVHQWSCEQNFCWKCLLTKFLVVWLPLQICTKRLRYFLSVNIKRCRCH